jgi:3-oxoacid CoA-transferase subunit B
MGGAMDLVAGVKRVVVIMEHTARDGSAKILRECTLPLTGVRVVDEIITDLAVFEIDEQGLLLTQIAPDTSIDQIRAGTDADFRLADGLG